jgi:hypothetical protein
MMLCFEVWRNDEKLITAGLQETGVLSFILSWVGNEPNASAIAASSPGAIPDLRCRVGGLSGVTHVEWYETNQLKLGDEVRIRLISTDTADPPISRETVPRGHPDWAGRDR